MGEIALNQRPKLCQHEIGACRPCVQDRDRRREHVVPRLVECRVKEPLAVFDTTSEPISSR